MQFDERTVRADGADLFVRSAGEGPEAVVLVHGGPGISHDYLLDLAAALHARGRRVAAYDQRGVGRSTGALDGDVPARMARDVAAVVAALGIERAHLLGHSGGGITLMACARTGAVADVVAGYVFVDSIAASASALGPALGALNGRVGELAAAGVVTLPPPGDDTEWLRAVWPAYFADPSRPDAVAPDGTTFRGAVFDAVMAAAGDYDFAPDLAALPVPAMAVVCAIPFGSAMGATVAGALPAGSRRLDLDCGHFPWVEEPERFHAALDEFLSR